MRRMNASDFKATCLALLDEVAMTGEEIVILKRGKPVAKLVAATREKDGYPQDALKGTVHIVGDIIGPVVDPDDWEANRPA
jgi:prevent-host-death family protein